MNQTPIFTAATDFLALIESADKARALNLFTVDAEVLDDGQMYRGHEQILEWLTGPSGEFTYTSTRLSTDQTTDGAVVYLRLDGNFPGNRVDLRYEFTRSPNGRISTLAITA